MKYSNLRQATEHLTKIGYAGKFRFDNQVMRELRSSQIYMPSDLSIIEYHRFKGIANPGNTTVIFALESKGGIKGTLILKQGRAANMELIAFMDKVPVRRTNA